MRINPYSFPGFLAILLWSLTVAFGRSLSESVGPLAAGACVYLGSGIPLVLYTLLKPGALRRMCAATPAYLFGCGALFICNNSAIYIAVGLAANRQQVLEVALVNYLWPMLTVLFSLAFLGRKANAWLLPGTLLALLGLFLVLTHGISMSWATLLHNLASNPGAYGAAATAAVSWSLYSTLTRRWAKPGDGGAAPLFILATGLVLLFLRLLTPHATTWSFKVAGEIALLAAASGLAYICWDIAMRKGDVILVAAASYLTPFFSTVVSCLYLRLVPGLSLWIGCLLLVAGSFLSWYSTSGKAAPASPRLGERGVQADVP
jgi:drug/metabolite transporter (DMT)-like permease